MAINKRKASGKQHKRRNEKRRRISHTNVSDEKTYKCDVLSDSKPDQLLVHWWGVDEKGRPYKDSWISIEDAVPGLLKDWEQWKQHHSGQHSRSESSVERLIERGPQSTPPSSPEISQELGTTPTSSDPSQPVLNLRERGRPSRRNRVISSSEDEGEEKTSSQITTIYPIATPPVTRRVSVLIPGHNTFQERPSQDPRGTSPVSDQAFPQFEHSLPLVSDRVIPDSQSLKGSTGVLSSHKSSNCSKQPTQASHHRSSQSQDHIELPVNLPSNEVGSHTSTGAVSVSQTEQSGTLQSVPQSPHPSSPRSVQSSSRLFHSRPGSIKSTSPRLIVAEPASEFDDFFNFSQLDLDTTALSHGLETQTSDAVQQAGRQSIDVSDLADSRRKQDANGASIDSSQIGASTASDRIHNLATAKSTSGHFASSLYSTSQPAAAIYSGTHPVAVDQHGVAIQAVEEQSYNSSFQYHYQEGGILDRLLNSDQSSLDENVDLQEDARALVRKMCWHTLHLDLIDDQPVTQASNEESAQYAIEISSKFAFLSSLINAARFDKHHILVFVEDGRPLAIVDDFLKQLDVTYASPSQTKLSEHETPLSVTLFATSALDRSVDSTSGLTTGPPYLVIAMDRSFKFSSVIKDSMQPIAVIQLMVPFSMEHVASEMPEVWSIHDLKHSFETAARIRDMAGRVDGNSEDAGDIGKRVAKLLTSGGDALTTELPDMKDLPLPQPVSTKRAAEDDLELYSSPKKARGESPMSDVQQTRRVTRSSPVKPRAESSSIVRQSRRVTRSSPTKQIAGSNSDVVLIEDIADVVSAFHATESSADKSSADVVRAALPQWSCIVGDSSGPALPTSTPAPARAQESRLQEKIATLKAVVGTFESQNKELWQAKSLIETQLREQLQAQEFLPVRISELENANTTLREEKAALREDRLTLREELKTANELLAGHRNPDLQQYGELQEKIQRVALLERQLKNKQQDNDWTIKHLREAQDTVVKQAAELKEMISERDKLVVQANGEMRRMREEGQMVALVQTRDELAKMTAQLAVSERALEKQAADAAALREENERLHGRLGAALTTRGSVRANSPGPATLGVPGQGRGSRAGTPLGSANQSAATSRGGSRQGTPQPGTQQKTKGQTITFPKNLFKG